MVIMTLCILAVYVCGGERHLSRYLWILKATPISVE